MADRLPPNPSRLGRPRVPKLALTVAEASEAVGLSPRTVEQLVRMGELSVCRVGRRVLIPVAGLRKWLDRKSQQQEVAP